MRVDENKEKLYLLVDIDDLLVYSSDKLQAIVDEKTNFKTEVLQMLEQLNRNCRYLVREVTKECMNAKNLGMKPELEHFLVFDSLDYNDKDIYTKPIEDAKGYLSAANRILNQFLEERDTFLETDNMIKGGQRLFNYEKEMNAIVEYSELIHNNKEAFHKINEFCLKEAEYLIFEAKRKNQNGLLNIPSYGELVSMDTNDIIKKNSITSMNEGSYKEYVLYKKPLHNLVSCLKLENRIHDIITNSRVFYTPSNEIVDYSSIHSIQNVNWDAVSLVRNLIHSGMIYKVYFSTHHNGGREEKAKIRLMNQILPEADGFIGQRFHDSEHDAERRGRSSKIDRAASILDISPRQILLFDDSKANCKDCLEKGGIPILYKSQTDSEIINGHIEETGFNRILDLKNNGIYDIVANACVKQKKK